MSLRRLLSENVPKEDHVSHTSLIGSLSSDNGDGNENVISKYKFALFSSLRDYLNVFNMTRVWYFLKDDTSRKGTPF